MQVMSVGDFDNNSAALFTDNTPRNWIRILGRGSISPNDSGGAATTVATTRLVMDAQLRSDMRVFL